MKHRFNINFDIPMFKMIKKIAYDNDVSISSVITAIIDNLKEKKIRKIIKDKK